jgi:hypothetical protein
MLLFKALEEGYVSNLIVELSKDYNYGDIAIIARTNSKKLVCLQWYSGR